MTKAVGYLTWFTFLHVWRENHALFACWCQRIFWWRFLSGESRPLNSLRQRYLPTEYRRPQHQASLHNSFNSFPFGSWDFSADFCLKTSKTRKSVSLTFTLCTTCISDCACSRKVGQGNPRNPHSTMTSYSTSRFLRRLVESTDATLLRAYWTCPVPFWMQSLSFLFIQKKRKNRKGAF